MHEPGFPVPPDEARRLAAVRSLGLLDTPAEDRFDRILKAAVRFYRVPMAQITLVDADRVWAKASFGPAPRHVARAESFCAHAVVSSGSFVVEDAILDPRFREAPSVLGAPYVRFYAGHPLRAPGGQPAGVLSLLDDRPRKFKAGDPFLLESLAGWAERELGDLELASTRGRLAEVESELARTRQGLETLVARQSRLSPEFVAGLTHETRTALNIVAGMADLLWESHLDTQQREHLHRLRNAAAELLARTARWLGLPAEKPDDPRPHGQAREDDRGLRILLAEDSEDNRDLIGRFLKKTPYEIDAASNGAIALAKYRQRPHDLVLMDLDMPIMDGYAATRAIRIWEIQNGRSPAPILALTASAVPEQLERSLESGCDAHLTKPVRKGLLLDAIRQWTTSG